MTLALIMGWVTAASLAAAYLRAHQRLVLVARASHELRGPFHIAWHGLCGFPSRTQGVDFSKGGENELC